MTEPDRGHAWIPDALIGEPAQPVATDPIVTDESDVDHPHPRRETGADEVRYEVARGWAAVVAAARSIRDGVNHVIDDIVADDSTDHISGDW